MWATVIEAAKAALFEKVQEMTKEEAKELLDKLGIKVGEVTDEILEKVEDYKAELDTETRRKVRAFWACITGLSSLVFLGIGLYLGQFI